LGVFFIHFLEIALFAVAIAGLVGLGAADGLDLGRFDALYYSASYYTTTGGPPLPTVPLRLLTVAETLTGVILIAWTASFLFMVMRKHGKKQAEKIVQRLLVAVAPDIVTPTATVYRRQDGRVHRLAPGWPCDFGTTQACHARRRRGRRWAEAFP